MEIIFEMLGQFIGEFLIALIVKPFYLLIIKPFLMLLGFINISISNMLKKDLENRREMNAYELEKAGGDAIIGSLVMVLIVSIVGLMVYFAFYMFQN